MSTIVADPTKGRPARPPLSHGDSGLGWDKTIEESVLGSLLIMPKAVPIALEILRPEDFFLPTYGRVFETIRHLHQEGMVIDPFSVSEWLKNDRADETCDLNLLLLLCQLPTVASDIRHLREILKRQASEREGKRASQLYLSGGIGMAGLHDALASLLERSAPSGSAIISLGHVDLVSPLTDQPAHPGRVKAHLQNHPMWFKTRKATAQSVRGGLQSSFLFNLAVGSQEACVHMPIAHV